MVSSPGRGGTTTSFVSPRSGPRRRRLATVTASNRQGRSPIRRALVHPSASIYTAATGRGGTATSKRRVAREQKK